MISLITINAHLKNIHIILNKEYKNVRNISIGEDITQIQRQEFPKWFKECVRHFEFYDTLNNITHVFSLIITNVMKLLHIACHYRLIN